MKGREKQLFEQYLSVNIVSISIAVCLLFVLFLLFSKWIAKSAMDPEKQ